MESLNEFSKKFPGIDVFIGPRTFTLIKHNMKEVAFNHLDIEEKLDKINDRV